LITAAPKVAVKTRRPAALSEKSSDKANLKKSVLYYHYAGLTNTGMVRDHNEDAYMLPAGADAETLARKGHLYVLADGMGGHRKGEVASTITIETVNSEYYTLIESVDRADPERTIAEALAMAIEKANMQVLDATQGGGTTIVATVLYEDLLISMNVGDSRAYLLRDNELWLISKDHSLVSRLVEMGKISQEDALTHPRRNVLYQALGQGSDVEIHIVSERLQVNDVIILCSDGLWGEIGDAAIKEVLKAATDPLVAAEQLIEMANQSGGPDNITTIIIQVSDKEPPEAGYTTAIRSPQPNFEVDDDTHPSLIAPKYSKPTTLPEMEEK
jgi:protein phosphatase